MQPLTGGARRRRRRRAHRGVGRAPADGAGRRQPPRVPGQPAVIPADQPAPGRGDGGPGCRCGGCAWVCCSLTAGIVCVCVFLVSLQLFRQTKLYQADGTVVLRDQQCVWLQSGGIQYGFVMARCTAQGWMKSQIFEQQSLKEANLHSKGA